MNQLDPTANSQFDSQITPLAEAPIPRLSILHLMLWTLCSAVYLAVNRASDALQGDAPSGYTAIRETSSVIQGVVIGAALAGTIVLAVTRIRTGRPMLRQPGHWLLFIAAVSYLIWLPIAFLMLLSEQFGVYGSGRFVVYGMAYLFPLFAFRYAGRHSRDRRWRVLFVALAVALAHCLTWVEFGMGGMWSYSLFGRFLEVPFWGELLLAGVVAAVSTFDLATGKRRDWLHWAGVTTHVIAISVFLIWKVGSWFFSRTEESPQAGSLFERLSFRAQRRISRRGNGRRLVFLVPKPRYICKNRPMQIDFRRFPGIDRAIGRSICIST